MNSPKTLQSPTTHVTTSISPLEDVGAIAASPAVTPTASTSPAPSAYRPRSWRYPMGLFQALLPLDDAPASSVDLRLGATGYGPRYGNRLAWARRFPGFGSTNPIDPACGACNA